MSATLHELSTAQTSPDAPTKTAAMASAVSAEQFRGALGHFASGLAIITGHDDSGPVGFTCQSFYSVSTAPPLVSFSVMNSSTSYPRLRQTNRFAVNVLSEAQRPVADRFARSGTDKWAGATWSVTAAGNPVLPGSSTWLDCTIWAEYEAGDHLIVVGEVQQLAPLGDGGTDPLLYHRGRYRRLLPQSP